MPLQNCWVRLPSSSSSSGGKKSIPFHMVVVVASNSRDWRRVTAFFHASTCKRWIVTPTDNDALELRGDDDGQRLPGSWSHFLLLLWHIHILCHHEAKNQVSYLFQKRAGPTNLRLNSTWLFLPTICWVVCWCSAGSQQQPSNPKARNEHTTGAFFFLLATHSGMHCKLRALS